MKNKNKKKKKTKSSTYNSVPLNNWFDEVDSVPIPAIFVPLSGQTYVFGDELSERLQ